MNYSLYDIPDSGKNPIVYMNIKINGEELGVIHIRLDRDVFPAGVENFVQIAAGQTDRVIKQGNGRYRFNKNIQRTYQNCKFHHLSYNNYIVSGDIYHNDGRGGGTIYNDEPIPPIFGDYYYSHDTKGLVSLIPFQDDETGGIYYDSTFMITLDNTQKTNILTALDKNQIVIGQICKGMDIIDKINKLIRPFAGRKYPKFVISKSGIYRNGGIKHKRPIKPVEKKKFIYPPKLIDVEREIA